LDARTGKRLWHFQTVHHDLWDYDLVTSPKLLTVRHKGKMVDVVAQATKFGFLYVFNRVTGQPLWPVEERPVPKSDVLGEASWPTQPFPTWPPPFARQKFTVEDINPYVDPEEKQRLRDIIAKAQNDGLFTPMSTKRNQISVPGENGGANWGAVTVDPTSGMLYVKSYDAPTIHKLTETSPEISRFLNGTPAQRGYVVYSRQCLTCHGPDRERIPYPKNIDAAHFKTTVRTGKGQMPAFNEDSIDADGLESLMAYIANPESIFAARIPAGGANSPGGPPRPPRAFTPPPPPPPPGQTRYYGPFGNVFLANNGLIAFSPPWSTLTAYDLNDGTIKWQVPIGTTPGLAAKGIRNTGSSRFIRNGPVATAGGLIFIATGPDRHVRALDKDTGKVIWEKEIPANPDGIPAIYGAGGRQFIAFFAAASPAARETLAFKPAEPDSQGYYVFALPKDAAAKVK
jgi:quinoprotein glucose dehydrogenase